MQTLRALQDALNAGVCKGAIIHETTGIAHPVEVIAAEGDRLIAIARGLGDDSHRFQPEARVRIELPRTSSVVHAAGRIRELRVAGSMTELELACPAGAEDRQRRMDVRIDADCRIRVRADGEWEDTRTINISAGGALLISDTSGRIGDIVEVELDLAGQAIRCQAKVVRRGVKANGAPSRTSAALEFLHLPEQAREAIAVFVLAAQAGEKLRHRR